MYRSFFMAFLLLFVNSCGYQFEGSGTVLPPDIKRISIPIVENNSTEPGLDLIVTEALRDRFERYGVIEIVDGDESADAVFEAKISSVERTTNTTTANTDTQLQLQTTMTLAARLKRLSGGVLWQNPRLVVSKVFGTTGSVVVTSSADFAGGSLSAGDLSNLDPREVSRSQEQEVLQDLSEEVARVVYNEAVAPDF